jgi:AraC-like DNA-binding protein
MAPHRYVIARRLDRSCELLRLRDVSIAEIASRTGFSDQSHFTRHFKRHYRTTPFAWRRAARGQSAP